MSCCNECEQSGGNCNQGLGLLGQQGTVTTGDYVLAGSKIAWGGHIVQQQDNAAVGWTQELEGRIKNALWAHGGFSNVNAGQLGGWLNPYISIRVTTGVDFAHLSDVFDTIEGAIWQSGYAPESTDFVVEYSPAQPNQSGIATAGTGGTVNASNSSGGGSWWPFGGGGSGGSISSPSECDWASMSWGNYLACQLGIKPTEAVIVGAVGALVGVIAISKLVK